LAVIRNERRRISERCSNSPHHYLQEFDNTLKLNEYPEKFISLSKKKDKRQRRHSHHSLEHRFFFKMPFISDRVNHNIKRIFQKENLNIGLAHKSKTLRSVLKLKETPLRNCELKDCPVKNINLCFQKNVIYKLTCPICHKTYIGSTIRPLHIRVKEHLTRHISSVFTHLKQCSSNIIHTEIITHERDQNNIRLREALLIKKYQPEMNSHEESEQYRQFLFSWQISFYCFRHFVCSLHIYESSQLYMYLLCNTTVQFSIFNL
jgi:hypothetical protein